MNKVKNSTDDGAEHGKTFGLILLYTPIGLEIKFIYEYTFWQIIHPKFSPDHQVNELISGVSDYRRWEQTYRTALAKFDTSFSYFLLHTTAQPAAIFLQAYGVQQHKSVRQQTEKERTRRVNLAATPSLVVVCKAVRLNSQGMHEPCAWGTMIQDTRHTSYFINKPG